MGWAERSRRRRTLNAMLGVVEPKPPAPKPPPAQESKFIVPLREMAAQIDTRALFEEMVLLSDQPVKFRALVEPMLRPDLPCCRHGWNEPHQKRCPHVLHAPTPLIVTPDQDVVSTMGATHGNVLPTDVDRPPMLVGPDGRPL